ncbi:hypothetical protein M2093_001539 [Breznakia sp. PH1-1]|nr:hypothetical protein [Breznakia sp. PH1-1]MDH6403916.1 hypothetical protein [Breznakia sp. PF1-11]MDH6411625.1 hypothetical protein [Breznakia sp. PFB1-11]MDH6414551.1 hypothetical protein [Breznakia sp. PFB1-14]MDH6418657.1 hypothetical protein [Breznakia sp. PFB1-12]
MDGYQLDNLNELSFFIYIHRRKKKNEKNKITNM